MAAGQTYTPIMTTTLSSATSSVVLSSIPSTYTDLVLIANGTTATGTENIKIRFNGDTGSNYSRTRILGDGSSASTERTTNDTGVGVGDWGTDRCFLEVHINSYSNTSLNKTVISKFTTEAYLGAYSGMWRSSSAINSITLYKNGLGNISIGTTFTLYGITAA